jgi:hypothetical protein
LFKKNIVLFKGKGDGLVIVLDENSEYEDLKNELKKQASAIKPNIYNKDWFIMIPEKPLGSTPMYNPQLIYQQIYHKVHLKSSDSVAIINHNYHESDEITYSMLTPTSAPDMYDISVDI